MPVKEAPAARKLTARKQRSVRLSCKDIHVSEFRINRAFNP